MDKFKLETSIQFPFFKMNELVTYSEVKKPSGVAYILLVLINESKDSIKDHYIKDGFADYLLTKNLEEEIKRIIDKY